MLWILCLDDEVFANLKKADIAGIRPVHLHELENADPQLAAIKPTRSNAEYYFTCTPCLPTFILKANQQISDITYIDADLYFFCDPEQIFSNIGHDSIAITPHRFSEKNKNRERWGIYNVAFNFFRRDRAGLECLDWWREQCIEWCYDRLEDGKFADQKYLNDWPARFPGVKVLDSPGINLAPWNVEDSELICRSGEILVDGHPLIFYHFHAFEQCGVNLFNPSFDNYEIRPSYTLRFNIYQTYANHYKTVSKQFPVPHKSLTGLRDHQPRWIIQRTPWSTAMAVIRGRLFAGL